MPEFVEPPGPKGHFLLGVLPEIRRDELDYLNRLVRDYGDFCRVRVVNIPAYIVSRPCDIESVLITNHRNFVKSVYLRESHALFGQGILTSEGAFWRRQRRMLQPAFRHDHIAIFARTMLAHTKRMLESWKDGEIHDIHQDMMNLTMEIIAHVLFGEGIGEETHAVGEALRVFFDQFDERFGLYAIPDWLPTPGNIRYRRAIGRLNALVNGIIRARLAQRHDNGDILSMLSRVRSEDGQSMDQKQLRDEVMTLFFTGHETTALALTWTWYLLAQHPEVQAKLGMEIDCALAGKEPEFEDLARLPYTEMVVKESLRLYPPAYGVVREPVADCEIGGYQVPKGATVAMFQWVVHRDPRYFERPEEFIPERWENDFEKSLPRCAYFPFGAGPRRCIGDGFAKSEVPLLLAAIAQQYRVDLVPEHPVLLSPTLTLRPRKGIKVVVRQRSSERVTPRSAGRTSSL